MSRSDDDLGAVAKPHHVNAWLNLAVKHIWRAWPWTFTSTTADLATTEDSHLVELPSDARAVKRVFLTDAQTYLKPRIERVLQDAFADTSGTPQYYCDGGLTQADLESPPVRNLKVYPKADGVHDLAVTYLRSAPSMTADEHYSPLPEEFDEAIVLWCLIRSYRKLEDIVQAREHAEALASELNDLKDQFASIQVERYPVLEPDEKNFI